MAYPGVAVLALGVAVVSFLFYYMSNSEQEQAYAYQSYRQEPRRHQPSCSSSSRQNSSSSRQNFTWAPDLTDKIRTENCAICLESLRQGSLAELSCSHLFHKNCIDLWVSNSAKRSCPICRATSAGQRSVH